MTFNDLKWKLHVRWIKLRGLFPDQLFVAALKMLEAIRICLLKHQRNSLRRNYNLHLPLQLCEITDLAQFPQYYSSRFLITTEDKIAHLKKETGIKFTSTERSGASLEDVLTGLEESVLYGNWRVFG